MVRILGIALIAIAAFFVLTIMPASSQRGPMCFDYNKMKQALKDEAGENKRAQAIVQGGRLSVELWRTDDGSTWTLIFVDPWGRACLLAVGEAWVSHSINVPPAPVLEAPRYDFD